MTPSGQSRWPYQSRIHGNSGVGDGAPLEDACQQAPSIHIEWSELEAVLPPA